MFWRLRIFFVKFFCLHFASLTPFVANEISIFPFFLIMQNSLKCFGLTWREIITISPIISIHLIWSTKELACFASLADRSPDSGSHSQQTKQNLLTTINLNSCCTIDTLFTMLNAKKMLETFVNSGKLREFSVASSECWEIIHLPSKRKCKIKANGLTL